MFMSHLTCNSMLRRGPFGSPPPSAAKCFLRAPRVTWKNCSCPTARENSQLGEATSVLDGFCPVLLGSQMEREGAIRGVEKTSAEKKKSIQEGD